MNTGADKKKNTAFKGVPVKNFARVKGGKITLYKPQQYQSLIDQFEGLEIEIVIRERFENTTTDQHGYYRAGIIRTCLEYEQFGGWTEDEIHDYFTDKYLSYTYHKTINGKTVEVRAAESTAEIGKKRMAQFITEVLQDLALMDIHPKEPEEYIVGKYKSINDESGNKRSEEKSTKE